MTNTGTNGNGSPLVWPTADFTRTPYVVYTSDEIFAREQQMIFNGETWVYLGLECEVAEPGSFTTSYLGTTQVVLSRGEDGELYAFVNKCAHRGAQVVRELRGQKMSHSCLYHGWTYDATGDLKVAPLAKGIMGNGGYPDDFKVEDHCLRKLSVDTHAGVVFGSLHASPPPAPRISRRRGRQPADGPVPKPAQGLGLSTPDHELQLEAVHGKYAGHVSRADAAFLHTQIRHVQSGQTEEHA